MLPVEPDDAAPHSNPIARMRRAAITFTEPAHQRSALMQLAPSSFDPETVAMMGRVCDGAKLQC